MKSRRFLSLVLAVIFVFSCMVNFAFAQMSFTIEDVVFAAANVKEYTYEYSVLPSKIRVGIYNLNMAEFFKLANEAVINIYKGKTDETMTVSSLEIPQAAADEVRSSLKIYIDTETAQAETKTGTAPEDSYIDMALRMAEHIRKKKTVPEYCEYRRSEDRITVLSFENVVYTWSKILDSYGEKQELPEYMNVFSWTSISAGAATPTPIPTSSVKEPILCETVSANTVLETAERVYRVIETEKTIPASVTIGLARFSMSEYLEAVVMLAVNVYGGEAAKNIPLYTREFTNASGESITSGSLTMQECAGIGENILAYYSAANKAVSYASSSIGEIGFENLVKIYSFIASSLLRNGKLPSSVSVEPWYDFSGELVSKPVPTDSITLPTPTKTPKPTETPNYENPVLAYIGKASVLSAAKRLKTSIDKEKELPLYITVEGRKLMPSQFLAVLASSVINAISTHIPLYQVENPENSAENMGDGQLNRTEYTSAAKVIERYAKYGNIAPSYIMTANGDMSFNALLYMFCDIADKLDENAVLPDVIDAKSWRSITGQTLPLPSVTEEVTAPPTPTPKPTPVPVPTPEVYRSIKGDTFGTGAIGVNGAVSSASAYASKIGLEILKAGGNAFDAAAATMFAVGLLEPSGSSIGGGGLAVVYIAEEKRYAVIDYMLEAPKTGGGTSSLARKACIPGAVSGAITMLEKYGTMTLEEILDPTIELAKKGFVVDAEFVYRSGLIERAYTYPTNLFTKNADGGKLKVGDTFRNEDYAKTLELIRDGGAEAFYNSSFTDEMVEYFKSINGALTKSDFANYETIELAPLTTNYRGYKVYAGSGSAQGGSRVVNMLSRLSATDMASLEHDSPQALRATAVAFGMSSRGSSLSVKTDVLKLLDDVVPYDNKTTTMLTTYDQWGNAVAANVTLGANFGCSVAVPGTGFCFNNGMGSNDVDDERVMSTMAPVIVAGENGLPMLMVGSPGDQAIITATSTTVSNIIDFNMNVCEAVNAPRWFGYAGTSSMTVETRYSAATLNTMRSWGYSLATGEGEYSRGVGCVSAIYVDEEGNIMSAADNRREYMSFAY